MSKTLKEIRNDILREMYSEAEPPLDFDEALEDPDELDDDWYKHHYLDPRRQREILETHCEKHGITDRERATLSIDAITTLGPCGDKQLVEEERNA